MTDKGNQTVLISLAVEVDSRAEWTLAEYSGSRICSYQGHFNSRRIPAEIFRDVTQDCQPATDKGNQTVLISLAVDIDSRVEWTLAEYSDSQVLSYQGPQPSSYSGWDIS